MIHQQRWREYWVEMIGNITDETAQKYIKE